MENAVAVAAKEVRTERERRGWSTTVLADRARAMAQAAGDDIKLSQQLVSQLENEVPQKVPRWLKYIRQAFDAADDPGAAPDQPTLPPELAYMSIEVLPSFAGMGGGGNGDGDRMMAMLPRSLIEDELRAKPDDLLMIDVRGDSMEPDFHHGDQILIDRRDRNPAQPGTFALFDGDAYVVKLVERVPREKGVYRVFSANDRYSSANYPEDEIQIMGRPVWFARRL